MERYFESKNDKKYQGIFSLTSIDKSKMTEFGYDDDSEEFNS